MDPVFHKEFLAWRKSPILDKTNPFIRRIYQEDINVCLNFCNTELVDKVVQAVEEGTVLVESIGDRTKTVFPK